MTEREKKEDRKEGREKTKVERDDTPEQAVRPEELDPKEMSAIIGGEGPAENIPVSW